ncbi:hypothetical protein BASA50_000666 [Batrachochytrium salamandrivorans]|uniref:Centrosomal protein of 44 kDa n=1 Tax=Batrachochytrium salamandrivorans TaxID=1357716 RepID=A0ABQ8ETL7_9FUNG|nr:hypothetical protein BASA62_004913 [Batrachochytrium salamandrivorans]KAH6573152.1 hypothetical protein BASA60_006166 [Batrachochytrium salamandrivorans]KAH6579614.1 hypothetical protein BASA61_010130 [Batrachochytrium salamandrivorans]KAH6586201.1 hypothetical protein BASA50_000666 [Batrachochytrium salamandrivorans]KAH9245890.1 hypothetical protein BASA81_016592 [Batrachochytrium salamandrivorans]
MATGDLRNNIIKVQTELKQLKYNSSLDIFGASRGDPDVFLPIVHHALLDYSGVLARYFADSSYDLYGKKDSRFMEAVYSLLRDEFNYKPAISREQFFSMGFAERKLIFVCDIGRMCRELVSSLRRHSRPASDGKAGRGIRIASGARPASQDHNVSLSKYNIHRQESMPQPMGLGIPASTFGALSSKSAHVSSDWTPASHHMPLNSDGNESMINQTHILSYSDHLYSQQQHVASRPASRFICGQYSDGQRLFPDTQPTAYVRHHDTELEAIYDESIMHEPQLPPAPVSAPAQISNNLVSASTPTKLTVDSGQRGLTTCDASQTQLSFDPPVNIDINPQTPIRRSILKNSGEKSPHKSGGKDDSIVSLSQADPHSYGHRLSPKKFRIVETKSEDGLSTSHRYYPREWGQVDYNVVRDVFRQSEGGNGFVERNDSRNSGSRNMIWPDAQFSNERDTPTLPLSKTHGTSVSSSIHRGATTMYVTYEQFTQVQSNMDALAKKNIDLEKAMQSLELKIEGMQTQISAFSLQKCDDAKTDSPVKAVVSHVAFSIQPASQLEAVPTTVSQSNGHHLMGSVPRQAARIDISQRILNIQQRISDTSKLLAQPVAYQ